MTTDKYPAIGSYWDEVDPRFERTVQVAFHDFDRRKVGITAPGSTRVTWAKLDRFNGKRGGYKPSELQ